MNAFHRNFGDSDGQPRQHEDSSGKLHDLEDAIALVAGAFNNPADMRAPMGVDPYNSALVEPAVDAAAAWFNKHLPG